MAIQLTDGTILPDIPISAELPFSIIMKWISEKEDSDTLELVSNYHLFQTSEKIMYVPLEVSDESYNAIGYKISSMGARYLYDSSLNQWIFQESAETNPDSNEVVLTPISYDSYEPFVLVWTNYDIMVAEKNIDGDYVETTIVANLIETYEDYNGIILPSLPFDVTNNYQYSLILNIPISDMENYYILMTITKPILYIPQQIATEDFEEEYLHDGALLFNGDIKGYKCSPLMGINNWIFEGAIPEGTLSPNAVPINEMSCIWTDFDIMVATKNENGEYVATDRIYDAIIDMVDYNGTILPEIPFDDTDEYKYSFILKYIEEDPDSEKAFIAGYYLFTSTTKNILYIPTELNLDSNGQALYLGGALHLTSNCKVYFYSPTEGYFNWELEDFSENIFTDALVPLQINPLLWTNFDIMVATKNENDEYVATDTIYDVIVDMIDYNGTTLPEIPQSSFKNAIIFEDNYDYDTISYFLAISEAQCSFFPGTELPLFGESDQLIGKSGFVSGYIYVPEIEQWICIDGETLSSETPMEVGESFSILWSNYTVKKVMPIEDDFAEIGTYYPPASEEPLPDIEHESNFYTVPADFLSSVATQARRLSNNSTRMTTEGIVEALANTGDYRKIFDKTIKKIDFELPEMLFPYQFAYCYSLESVETEKTKYIFNNCFADCHSLQKISLPQVKIIEDEAFINCSVVNIELPNLVSLGDSVFANCSSLNKVNLPEISEIGYNAFEYCESLSQISLPKVNRINDYTFYNCTNLSTINLPEANEIGNSVFCNCTNLSVVDLPKVSEIGESAFEYCESLSQINLPKANRIGGYTFYGCTNLSTVNLPEVNEINYGTFSGCSALTNIVLPKVINISNCTFYYCTNLSTVDLPYCISFGGLLFSSSYSTFYNCYDLTTLILRAPKKCHFPSDNNVFKNTPIASGTGYIYVPSALLESYIADPVWATYAAQFRAIEDYPDICGTEIGWFDGDKDITEKLKRGRINKNPPDYTSDSNFFIAYTDLDLIVNEGDNISVNIPENYTFKIYVLNNGMVDSYLGDGSIYFNSSSDWLVKGETYTIPSDSPCAIWIEIAKEDGSQAIEISELGTVTVTKNIT